MHLRHPIQWDSPEYPPRPVCTFRTAHRVYQNDGRMLPQNGQLDNPLFEIFYRKVCGDALHHEEVPETTRRAGICRGSTAAFRLCNGAKFVYNEENEKLAPRIGRQRSRKRPARAERRGGGGANRRRDAEARESKARAERRRGGKARREQNASAAGKQGEGGTSGRQESKARAERRRGGKARRGRNVGAVEKQTAGGMSERRKSKRRAERQRGRKARRWRNVGAVGKQGEDGMPVRRKSKPQVGCGDAGKQTAGGMRRHGKESPRTR